MYSHLTTLSLFSQACIWKKASFHVFQQSQKRKLLQIGYAWRDIRKSLISKQIHDFRKNFSNRPVDDQVSQIIARCLITVDKGKAVSAIRIN